jgi:hypothetical protein
MAKEPKEPKIEKPGTQNKYFRLVRTERNLFCVETIYVTNDVIDKKESTEATFLPIAFDKLRRSTGESFFAAVKANA